MIDALVVVVLVATGALAVFGVATTVANRPAGRSLKLAVGAVVGLLAVQAAIAAARVLRGATVPETTTFLIYLGVSVCVLPVATQFATERGASGASIDTSEPTRWGGTVVAVGAVATGVAVLRLQGLWNAGA